MAYRVDRYNGTFLVSVEDGTVDTTTDLRFLGKNYAGYGEVQNENFLHLLENFANTTAPPKAISGQIWFDSGTKKLKFYDGSKFRTAGGAEIGSTPPSGLTTGDFWFDTSADQLYTWNGSDYVLVGPAASPTVGESAVIQDTVKDDVNSPRSILKVISEGQVVAVVSSTEFTLSGDTPITGFNSPYRIKKGITLRDTNGTTGVTATDNYFWGTASNSLKLGGFSASDFVRSGSAVLSTLAVQDPGITVGTQNDLRIWVENSDTIIIEDQSNVGNGITMRVRVDSADRNTLRVLGTGIYPGIDSFFDFGAIGLKWKTAYSDDFYGRLTGNLLASDTSVIVDSVNKKVKATLIANDSSTVFDPATGIFTGIFTGNLIGNVEGDLTGTADDARNLSGFSLDQEATAETVAARTVAGAIKATQFIGTADTALRLKIDNSAVDDPLSLFKSAKTTKTANTIAARDSAGNLLANVFDGTATAARYADLAEKYLADAEYEVGTVVCVGGEKEITASVFGERALGVVSANPAVMMNSELDGGTYIALKGRVPVKVQGPVKKGDRLVADNGGIAVVGNDNTYFAIALETNESVSKVLVECVIL